MTPQCADAIINIGNRVPQATQGAFSRLYSTYYEKGDLYRHGSYEDGWSSTGTTVARKRYGYDTSRNTLWRETTTGVPIGAGLDQRGRHDIPGASEAAWSPISTTPDVS